MKLPGFKQYDELPAYYGCAAAFVHVSLTEPWGLVVNEAMASGLPVVVSRRCGCAADLVEEGKNGFVVDPMDSDGIARALVALSRPGCAFAAMGRASETIIARWGLDAFVTGMQNAVAAAQAAPPMRAAVADRVLLRALSYR